MIFLQNFWGKCGRRILKISKILKLMLKTRWNLSKTVKMLGKLSKISKIWIRNVTQIGKNYQTVQKSPSSVNKYWKMRKIVKKCGSHETAIDKTE